MKSSLNHIIIGLAMVCTLCIVGAPGAQAAAPADPAIVKAEFIADNPPFPTSHASTIVETREGLLAAWFGGQHERSLDVSIYLSRNDGRGWTPPEEVANGIDEPQARRYPCWNPVLFLRKNSELLLFYKVGPSPESWWGMLKTSTDNGKTWSKAQRLPKGIIGPVRNKPVELADGTLLCGASAEDAGWRVHMESMKESENVKSWHRTGDLNSAMQYGAIQPTILDYGGGKVQILCRTKQGVITECWSTNQAARWNRMMPTKLPNPNSAIDAVMLHDGRALLVYNHATEDRKTLNVAASADGLAWQAALLLENEPGEYSYPAIIQTSDGLVHVTYTWKRERIKHVVLDPLKLQLRDMPGGRWP